MGPGRRYRQSARGLLVALLGWAALCLSLSPAGAAPAVQPGVGIGPITLGMSEAALLKIVGSGARPTVAGEQKVFAVVQKLTIWVFRGHVVQIRTTNPFHTVGGFGIGLENWQAAREALCQGVSLRIETPSGFEIRCPFAGLSIEITQDRISAFSVFTPDRRETRAPQTEPGRRPSRPPRLTGRIGEPYCGQVAYIAEFVIIRAGPILNAYIVLKTAESQGTGADGLVQITFNGKYFAQGNISCDMFGLLKRTPAASVNESFGLALPGISWSSLPAGTLNQGRNSAALRVVTPYGMLEKSAMFIME